MRTPALPRPLLIALLAVAPPGTGVIAQDRADTGPLPGLHGHVVDARTGTPLEGATVTLEVTPLGALTPSGTPGGAFVPVARRTTSRSDGAYRFADLAEGSYRLHVVRLGYSSATVDVRYRGAAGPTVSVGLEVEAIELEPLAVVGHRTGRDLLPLSGSDARAADRVAVADMRSARYVPGDVRTLTGADLTEAVTLGETDLLRALHRLPGVTADDDWSAEPWTRGSRWDETRIYFDGLPLLDPVHVGGALTSISPDLVGALTFHPGAQPASYASASGAVVDLRSRPAVGEERLSALGRLSVLSARGSVDRPLGAGSGVTVSARRSYIEALTREEAGTRPEDYVPYRFGDFGGRWDQTFTRAVKVEISGLSTFDDVDGDVSGTLKGTRARWGSSVLRGTLQLDALGLRSRLTVGRSRYRADVELAPFDARRSDLDDAAVSAPMRNRVDFGVRELVLTPADPEAPVDWEVGLQSLGTSLSYDGPAPWPYPDAVNAGRLLASQQPRRLGAWGSVHLKPVPVVDVSVGVRVDDGEGPATLDPRVAATWRTTGALRLSAAVARHRQYEQALAPAGFEVGPGLVPSHLWVAASGEIPEIEAEVVTAGAELWLPGGWLASATLYGRRSSGQLAPPPDSGFVRAYAALDEGALGAGWSGSSTGAYGAEIGARRLTGRWTGSASYTFTHARTTVGDRVRPAPGERPHALDATLLFHLSHRTRLGAAYTASSGAPFTRFYSFRCADDPYPVYCPGVEDAPEVVGFNEAAGAERTASYASLDIHFETEGTIFGLPFGFYAQIRNLLDRANPAAYEGSILECGDEWDVDCTAADHFERGMPRLPLVGFWIRL